MKILECAKVVLESFKDLDQFHAAVLLCIIALGVVSLSLAVIWYAIKMRST